MPTDKKILDENDDKNFTSYFLMQNRAFKITLPLTTIIALAILLFTEFLWPEQGFDPESKILFIKKSVQIITVMLFTSLSGYALGALVVTIYFSIIMVLQNGFVYTPMMLMIASLVANVPAMRNWYSKIYKTLLADLLSSVVLGAGTNMLILFLTENLKPLLEAHGVVRVLLWGLPLLSFLYTIPCTIVCLCCYLYHRFMPKKIKRMFFADSYSSENLQRLKVNLATKKGSKVSTKISIMIVLEAIVLIISAFGFSSGLLVDVFGGQDSEMMILYISRLFFLMLMVALPVIFLAVANMKITLVNPLSLMAKAVEDAGAEAQDEFSGRGEGHGGGGHFVGGEKCPVAKDESVPDIKLDIHALGIKNDDEIGTLYKVLVQSVDNARAYIERMQREQELQKNLEIAEAATKAKSVFLSNMSHEIRTPINAVLGLDEMILRESSEPEIINYAQDIQNAGKSLLSLVNDILDFSKIEAGKMEILPVEYDLSSTINDLVNMIEKRAEDKGLSLDINVDENIPHLLYGDEIRIKQCVVNILTNAVKYTEKGSVTLGISYEKKDEERIALTVHVKDTGIGIKEEDIGKLFTAFQRIEEKRNRTIEGTGLGMNIVQQILGLMGSTLMVDSVYGEGSDFYFTVAQKVVKWEPLGNFSESYRHYQEGRASKKYTESFQAPEAAILVTDDTPLNLTVVKGLLKQTKINVETATSGQQTLSLVQKKKYDMIFIDHRMPQMDGIETLVAMKALDGNMNRETPCIALTANAVSGAREMYLEAGFNEYLTKPIDSKKLEHMLLSYLPPEKIVLTKSDGANSLGAEDEDSLPKKCDSFLYSVEGIDAREAEKNCGSKEVLYDAVREFVRAIPEKSGQIERYAEEKDYKNYTILVHALKSSARLIGALGLSEKAKYLEECGDRENGAEIEAKTGELLFEYRSFAEKLSPLAEKKCDSKKEALGKEQYDEALLNLRECVEAFDFGTADQIVSMIDEYEVPEGERERFEKIKRQVSAVDHAAVLALIDENR